MKRRSLYSVLGVTSDASSGGIRAAYLALARKLHPDHSGEADGAAFREVKRAYEVLTDPRQRARYDRELGGRGQHLKRAAAVAQRPLESLVEEQPLTSRQPAVRPHSDRNRRGWGDLPGAGSAHDLELVLAPEEARRGGLFELSLPLATSCPDCAGSGHVWPFLCAGCGGRGALELRRRLRLQLPPRIPPGTVLEFAVPGLGGMDADVRLHLIIASQNRSPPMWRAPW